MFKIEIEGERVHFDPSTSSIAPESDAIEDSSETPQPKERVQDSAAISTPERIIFEQPVHELVRTSLRLERLFEQINYALSGQNSWDSHHFLLHLVDLLNLLDRPDLKSKLFQEFKRIQSYLDQLSMQPSLDKDRFSETYVQIENALFTLHRLPNKLGQSLRDNEFLSHLRQHLLSPGGGCSFDTPAYYHWLQQSHEVRQAACSRWLETLKPIQNMIHLALYWLRHSHQPEEAIAVKGFYQTALSQTSCQLIQVILPADCPAIPEISAGRHRLSVRFHYPSDETRPSPYHDDVAFQLNCCGL